MVLTGDLRVRSVQRLRPAACALHYAGRVKGRVPRTVNRARVLLMACAAGASQDTTHFRSPSDSSPEAGAPPASDAAAASRASFSLRLSG
jgi:hypothetical protein